MALQFQSGLRKCPPKSNLQRQREFAERNPHYYRDRRRQEKARHEAVMKLRSQHPELTIEQALDIVHGRTPAPRKVTTPPREETSPPVEVTIKQPLLLPAVAESHRPVTINLPQPVILIKTPPPGMSPGMSPGTSRPPRKAG